MSEQEILDAVKAHMTTLDPKQRKRFDDKLTALINEYLGIPF